MNVRSPWLTPMDPKLLGGLRGMVSQYSDGTGNTLVPRQLPTMKKRTYSYITAS
jgi:hypothetical protein